MSEQRLLISWIGHADLAAMCETLPNGEEIKKLAKINIKTVEQPGPIKTSLLAGKFDRIHLLSNYDERLDKHFPKFLGAKATIHRVELSDPTDYQGIFKCTNEVLSNIAGTYNNIPHRMCILLSPGTPAMAVVWVLLGKSRYPATFYQTARGQLTEAKIPADLFDEFVPELLRDRDIAFQHLASHNPSDVEGFEDIIGSSSPIRIAVGRAQRAAFRDVPVLLLGESGSGKEVFAQAIHKASRRRNGPFEAINCAAIPKDLLESELFGSTKGAFTGADKDREGAFTRAHGGTLFLDEIGECDPLLQAKLLRVLQPPTGKGPCYREFRSVGGSKTLISDVRLVAATNRNLQHEITENRFREDLYYRLAVITLKLPPLRERKSDIPALALSFLKKINEDFRKQDPGYKHKSLSVAALDFAKKYHWPGNIRQLYNSVLQAAVMTDNDVIDRRDMIATIGEMDPASDSNALDQPLGDGFSLDEHMDTIHRHYLTRAMNEAKGVKTHAARLLGIKSYQALDAQLKRMGVDLINTRH